MFPLRDTQPVGRFPLTTVSLIAINLVAFATFQLKQGGDISEIHGLALVPGKVEWCLNHLDVLLGNPLLFLQTLLQPFLTSMFLHADWAHILGNLWFLFVFGRAVEGRLGSFNFLAFYLTAGLAAGVFHVAITLGTEGHLVDILGNIVLFDNPDKVVPVIGASGAIAGILGAYLFLFPLARVLAFFPPVFFFYLPALFFLGFWFAIQLLNARAVSESPYMCSSVAWWAHVGGFIGGVALIALWEMLPWSRPRRLKRRVEPAVRAEAWEVRIGRRPVGKVNTRK